MRLNESIVTSAPPKLVWDYLAEPSNYLHFMSGITRWEVAGDRRTGLGARYRMLIKVGSAEGGGLIEIVEWHGPRRDLLGTALRGAAALLTPLHLLVLPGTLGALSHSARWHPNTSWGVAFSAPLPRVEQRKRRRGCRPRTWPRGARWQARSGPRRRRRSGSRGRGSPR